MISPAGSDYEYLLGEIEALKDRVAALESARPEPPLDDRILQILRVIAPVKANSGSIAANLGVEIGKVHNAVRRLAEAGKVQSVKPTGSHHMYWVDL